MKRRDFCKLLGIAPLVPALFKGGDKPQDEFSKRQEEIRKLRELAQKENVCILTAQQPPRSNRIETGFPTLDEALGGGFQRGEIVAIIGGAGTGKTAVLNRIKEVQKKRNWLHYDEWAMSAHPSSHINECLFLQSQEQTRRYLNAQEAVKDYVSCDYFSWEKDSSTPKWEDFYQKVKKLREIAWEKEFCAILNIQTSRRPFDNGVVEDIGFSCFRPMDVVLNTYVASRYTSLHHYPVTPRHAIEVLKNRHGRNVNFPIRFESSRFKTCMATEIEIEVADEPPWHNDTLSW